jgi:glycosyltransferase involved in cell wall biosynthesis
MENAKILIFISHYFPGFKMGGPINSVLNITAKLKDQYNFHIITSDRDMGDTVPYDNIKQQKWTSVKDCKVMYYTTNISYYIDIIKHLRKNSYDVVYINSFFEFKFSIFIVLIKYFKLAKIKKIVITPRGELFDEALVFGKFKKKVFLNFFKILRLYKNVTWHSTAEAESETIYKHFPNAHVKLARVISDDSSEIHEINEPEFSIKEDSLLKIIFLSRISKDKNLLYAIKLFLNIEFNAEFHIYGPIEDEDIWKQCLDEIKRLPDNVKVLYKGHVEKKYVKSYFSKYDLFLFPTHRENFGHVISESLSVGTPVLVSDNTPWRNLVEKKMGWDVNLKNEKEFIDILAEYQKKQKEEKDAIRNVVKRSYKENMDQENIVKENIDLFIGI